MQTRSFGDWGTTIWGSDDDKAALELDFFLFLHS